MDELDSLVRAANQRLKSSRLGVSILRRGEKLSLRANLPPKPDSVKTQPWQQTIALDIYANPAGVNRAEGEARKVGGLLACKEFSWAPYYQPKVKPERTVGEWAAKFERDYFTRRSRSPKSLTTWRTEYQTVFNALPTGAELTVSLLQTAIAATRPDSRSRRRFCMVAGQLAKFSGLEFDFAPLAGTYSPRRVAPRDLPTDKSIAAWREQIPATHGWQFAFGLMATYGLRNHEVFNLELESLTVAPGILTVLDGKTGPRRIWPCHPEWWQRWQLWEVERLPQVSGRDNSALGGRVTQAFKRHGFLHPYNLRHAWAVRSLEYGLDVSLAAAQMGHSVQVHTSIYHHWISDRHHQRAFELLMQRSDRPIAP